MKMSKLILGICLIASLALNVYLIKNQMTSNNKQQKIDLDFKASIGRISGSLDSVTDGNYTGYLTAIEHASKAHALSKYSSYNHETSNITGTTSELIHQFRSLYANQKNLTDKERLLQGFQQLSADPNNRETMDDLLMLLNKQ
ncbi:hypothetical protein [Paenibacillus oleatilyticus]|uniref:hypothetical protein n=1 Tax=Paenibacillus oleatilyticus TaxID=2594886 RepID=UPI001C1F82D5|nr:hypothetical protein [Paenibacillus oleatilyticus]MBU7320957.1 hypothetical protein [Paenibacillus oleatilyticus]